MTGYEIYIFFAVLAEKVEYIILTYFFKKK